MKKITILALHLGYGGIEQSIIALANALVNDYEVEIVSTYNLESSPTYKINNKINIKYIFKKYYPSKKEWLDSIKKINIITFIKESYRNFVTLLTKKNKTIRAIEEIDSDIVITTRSYHNKLVGKHLNKNIKKIAWEHNHHNDNKKYINEVVKSVKGFDCLVLVSKELATSYKKHLDKGIKCVYIPLIMNSIPAKLSNLSKKNIVSVGRLVKVKGYSDLLEVVKIVFKEHSDWQLHLIGDGEERLNLEKKIDDLNLKENVILHGYLSSIERDKILEESSIYVMTSLSESYGLVLLEAFSFGIPCLSFSSARGSLEIIEDEINGYIIKRRNKEEMAKKIIELIEDKDLRINLGRKGLEKIEEHKEENVKEKWIEIIEK